MFITAIVLAVIALIVLAVTLAIKPGEKPENTRRRDRYGDMVNSDEYTKWRNETEARKVGKAVTGVLVFAALLFTGLSMIYIQNAGQGVIVTRIGGQIVKDDLTQGFGTKAPWDKVHKWDLFTRDVSLSAPDGAETAFDKGEVTGARIATSVKSGEESGAQVWYDLDLTYNFCAVLEEGVCEVQADLKKLYSKYRSQDRFTRQVIYPVIQKAARSVPSQYTTTEFRGAGSVQAGDLIAAEVNEALKDIGISVTVATVKDVDFTKKVEESLSLVEEKQQQEEAARADAAAKQVQNEQLIKNAEAEAEANKIISDSLTKELIQLRQIEAYGKGTVYVVPSDSTPFIQPK
jgi:regulator of protease activity HflC (stomatin/prohibitin superfamily)